MADIKNLFHINAPVETVFDAVSSIQGLRGWWTTDVSGTAKVNSAIKFRFGKYGGPDLVVEELTPNDLIILGCVDGADDWIGTTLQFKLDRNEEKTRVRFEHAHFKTADDFFASCSFSWGRYLESLRSYCETGHGKPFGSVH